MTSSSLDLKVLISAVTMAVCCVSGLAALGMAKVDPAIYAFRQDAANQYKEGNLDKAAELLQKAIAKAKATNCAPEVGALITAELAVLEQARSRPKEATALFFESLHQIEKNLWAAHPDALRIRTRLIKLSLAQNDCQQAKKLLTEQIALIQSNPRERGELSDCLTSLAFVYDKCGEHERAAQCFARLTEFDGESGKRVSQNTADNHQQEGLFYMHGKKWKQAERCFREALSIKKQERHVTKMGDTLYFIAHCCSAQKRNNEADTFFERALEAYQNEDGPESPTVATCLETWACAAADAGQWEKARSLFERAVPLKRRLYGDQSVETAQIYMRQGDTLLKERDWAGAEDKLQKAVSRMEKQQTQPVHRAIYAQAVEALALVYKLQGKTDLAAAARRKLNEKSSRNAD